MTLSLDWMRQNIFNLFKRFIKYFNFDLTFLFLNVKKRLYIMQTKCDIIWLMLVSIYEVSLINFW